MYNHVQQRPSGLEGSCGGEAGGDLEDTEPHHVGEGVALPALGVVHVAGRRDAQSNRWVQLAPGHGADGEAAHRHAGSDGQGEVEAL